MIIYQDASVTIFQSALYQTNSLIYSADNFLLLVDPNWLPSEVQFIRSHIDQYHSQKTIYLLFTHSDFDHIIAYGLFPEAKVIASKAFQNNPNKAVVLEEIIDFDQKHYLKRNYPITYPEVDFIIEKDGTQLEIEGERLHFYLSPGHNPDGIFTIIESAGIFIAGDYLSDLEFPFIYHSSFEYEKTINKVDFILQNHIINLMIPGHGQFLKNNNKEILIRRDRDLAYVQELRKSILEGTIFPVQNWLDRFPFPDGLKEEQRKNNQQVTRDLGMNE